MEKIIDKNNIIIDENEKLIANIIHDIKSPLYSIKIGLQNKLDSELNKDIFETAVDLLNYIENFLTNYSFKKGKFETKTSFCDIKNLINKKLENYKYIFLNKNINIEMFSNETNYIIKTIPVFISSIIGNIISNIAMHAKENTKASIDIYRKENSILIEFKNEYDSLESDFSMGLNFAKNLAIACKTCLKFTKTKNKVIVNVKIPSLN